jgi:hypothetical protein
MLASAKYLPVVILGSGCSAHAQLSQDTRFSIIGSLHSIEGAARIPMPLGKNGVELSSDGLINRDKLQKELAEHSQAILPGKVVPLRESSSATSPLSSRSMEGH